MQHISLEQRVLSKAPLSSGEVESVVVFFHGFGAQAEDLFILANHWAPLMPTTLFLSLNAPFAMAFPGQRMWFTLEDWDAVRVWRCMPGVSDYIRMHVTPFLDQYEVFWDKVGFVGFSQGGVVALSQGLYFFKVGAVLCYSGLFLPSPEAQHPFKVPCALIHGQEDCVVPTELFHQSEKNLQRLNVSCEPHLLPGLGHSIDGPALSRGVTFLKKSLYSS